MVRSNSEIHVFGSLIVVKALLHNMKSTLSPFTQYALYKMHSASPDFTAVCGVHKYVQQFSLIHTYNLSQADMMQIRWWLGLAFTDCANTM